MCLLKAVIGLLSKKGKKRTILSVCYKQNLAFIKLFIVPGLEVLWMCPESSIDDCGSDNICGYQVLLITINNRQCVEQTLVLILF